MLRVARRAIDESISLYIYNVYYYIAAYCISVPYGVNIEHY